MTQGHGSWKPNLFRGETRSYNQQQTHILHDVANPWLPLHAQLGQAPRRTGAVGLGHGHPHAGGGSPGASSRHQEAPAGTEPLLGASGLWSNWACYTASRSKSQSLLIALGED